MRSALKVLKDRHSALDRALVYGERVAAVAKTTQG
jgi:hypothetical protein